MMLVFKRTIDVMQIKELKLRGRRFTWSNEQANPTMTRIDRFFCSTEWEMMFPNADLQVLATMKSDHAPLFLQGELSQDAIHEVVQSTWEKTVNTQDAILCFHVKLLRIAKAIKLWRNRTIGDVQLRLAIA